MSKWGSSPRSCFSFLPCPICYNKCGCKALYVLRHIEQIALHSNYPISWPSTTMILDPDTLTLWASFLIPRPWLLILILNPDNPKSEGRGETSVYYRIVPHHAQGCDNNIFCQTKTIFGTFCLPQVTVSPHLWPLSWPPDNKPLFLQSQETAPIPTTTSRAPLRGLSMPKHPAQQSDTRCWPARRRRSTEQFCSGELCFIPISRREK